MHSFSDVIAALIDLKERGIVSAYAIAGGMAVSFWCEAIATFDLDVLVLLPETGAAITSLEPIYGWAADRHYEVLAEHIVIADVPVQFLPAYNRLAEEAVREAATLDYKGLPVSVVRPGKMARFSALIRTQRAGKARLRRDRMAASLEDKLQAVLKAQRLYVDIAGSQRPLMPWQRPWKIVP